MFPSPGLEKDKSRCLQAAPQARVIFYEREDGGRGRGSEDRIHSLPARHYLLLQRQLSLNLQVSHAPLNTHFLLGNSETLSWISLCVLSIWGRGPRTVSLSHGPCLHCDTCSYSLLLASSETGVFQPFLGFRHFCLIYLLALYSCLFFRETNT